MKVCIVGASGTLGRYMVQHALGRGYEVGGVCRESSVAKLDAFKVREKILRVQDLWDDIARSPRDVEITPAQREEADRRLLAHENNPQEYSSWDEITRRLEGGR